MILDFYRAICVIVIIKKAVKTPDSTPPPNYTITQKPVWLLSQPFTTSTSDAAITAPYVVSIAFVSGFLRLVCCLLYRPQVD